MLHLFRFAAGVLTGMAAMRLIQSKKAKAGLEKAEDSLREATVATLEAVEAASAKARTHLAGDEPAAEDPAAAAPPGAAAEPSRARPKKPRA